MDYTWHHWPPSLMKHAQRLLFYKTFYLYFLCLFSSESCPSMCGLLPNTWQKVNNSNRFLYSARHTVKGHTKMLSIFPPWYLELHYCSMRPIPLKHHVIVYKVLWCNLLPIKPGTPGRTPSLSDKCTGFFFVCYTTHGTNGLMSNPKDEASWLSVLLKGSGHYW